MRYLIPIILFCVAAVLIYGMLGWQWYNLGTGARKKRKAYRELKKHCESEAEIPDGVIAESCSAIQCFCPNCNGDGGGWAKTIIPFLCELKVVVCSGCGCRFKALVMPGKGG